jgi:hypothetical protein
MSSQCPNPFGTSQTCSSNKCSCSGDDDRCGNASLGSKCEQSGTPNFCYYTF